MRARWRERNVGMDLIEVIPQRIEPPIGASLAEPQIQGGYLQSRAPGRHGDACHHEAHATGDEQTGNRIGIKESDIQAKSLSRGTKCLVDDVGTSEYPSERDK